MFTWVLGCYLLVACLGNWQFSAYVCAAAATLLAAMFQVLLACVHYVASVASGAASSAVLRCRGWTFNSPQASLMDGHMLVVALLRFCLHLFFRRIESRGRHRVRGVACAAWVALLSSRATDGVHRSFIWAFRCPAKGQSCSSVGLTPTSSLTPWWLWTAVPTETSAFLQQQPLCGAPLLALSSAPWAPSQWSDLRCVGGNTQAARPVATLCCSWLCEDSRGVRYGGA